MKHNESSIQRAVVDYLTKRGMFVFATPNGGKRGIVEASIMKGEGVKAGVSDLTILLDGGVCVFVEMKTAEGKQSESQKAFQAAVEKKGFAYMIWRSVDDAVKFADAVARGVDVIGFAHEYAAKEEQLHATKRSGGTRKKTIKLKDVTFGVREMPASVAALWGL